MTNKNCNELWFDPSEKELKKIFQCLEVSSSIVNNNRICYLFVYGKQKRKKIEEISLTDGLELISVDFYGPKILKGLSFLISGYAGLIKLNNSSLIGEVMESLSHLSMVGMFSFDSSFEQNFIQYYFQNNYKSYYPEKFVKKDSHYFSFILDGDNTETQSGVLAITSFGDNCPKDLRDIFKNFGKYGYLGKNAV